MAQDTMAQKGLRIASMAMRSDWLAQVQEEPIDPEREIVDPHHHLWDRNGAIYELNELWADTGCGQVHGERRAEATQADQEHGGILQLCLSARSYLAQVEVSTVMRELAGRKIIEGIGHGVFAGPSRLLG